MSPSRTWKLHLNLDIFNGLYIGLRTPQDQSDFLWGLSLGMNGEDAEEGASRPFTKGFEFGSTMRQEADGYRESRRQIGMKGGAPSHKEPHGKPHGSPVVTTRYTYGEDQVNAIHNPQSLILNPLIQDPQTTNSPPSAAEPPRPPKGRKPKATTSMMGEEFQSFLDLVWKPYPSRRRVGTDELMGKGRQQEAFQRAKDLLKREGKDWVWLGQVVRAYPNHPNAKNGYIQQVEVFLGEKGHWLECASRLQRDGELRKTLDGSGHRGLPALHPGERDTGTEALPVLEAQCSDGGGPEGPSLYLPALRG